MSVPTVWGTCAAGLGGSNVTEVASLADQGDVALELPPMVTDDPCAKRFVLSRVRVRSAEKPRSQAWRGRARVA